LTGQILEKFSWNRYLQIISSFFS